MRIIRPFRPNHDSGGDGTGLRSLTALLLEADIARRPIEGWLASE
ncbi:MAG: hypothetical protein ACLPJJ_11345 [Acidocella sp.]